MQHVGSVAVQRHSGDSDWDAEASMADAATRLVTIYALTGGDDRRWHGPDTSPGDHDAAGRIFGPDARLESAPTDLSLWAPRFFGEADWDPADYSVPEGMPYTVTGVRTYFAGFPFAGDVLVLELRLLGDLDDYIFDQRHTFDRLVPKHLAGEDLLLAAVSRVSGLERDGLDGLRLGHDKHQLMVLSDADTALVFSGGADGRPSLQASGEHPAHETEQVLDLDQIDLDALGRLMFKDVDISYRPARVPISLPDDINGPDRQMVAVWASNTVVAGIAAYGVLGERRIRELLVVAAQTVAAANRCREIRMATLSVLRHLDLPVSSDQDPDGQRAELTRYERELHALEFDLSFGVDVYRGPALVRGGRPLERYQEAVRAEGGFDASVDLTYRMVEHLTSIVTTRRQIFEVTVSMVVSQHQADQLAALNELLARTEGVKTAGIVVATIAVVVSCVALFATLAAVPASTSAVFFGPQFRSAAAAALSVILAGALGYGVHRASLAPKLSDTAMRRVRLALPMLASICLAGLMLALVLWSHSGAAVHVYALAGAMAAGLAAVFLAARTGNFGKRRNKCS